MISEVKLAAARLALTLFIYLRVSSEDELRNQPENADPKPLIARGQKLGWDSSVINVIDCDLGLSGATFDNREGYIFLLEQVQKDAVGAILVYEISRLNRSLADFLQLLCACRDAGTLIIDRHKVYDPRDRNDRLVLIFLATMSEHEREWILERTHGARIYKAQNGTLKTESPVGFVRDLGTGKLMLDPNDEVQGFFRLFFNKFKELRSARKVLNFFIENQIQVPVKRGRDHLRQVKWVAPNINYVLRVLYNPFHAGTFAYGRGHTEKKKLIRSDKNGDFEKWVACIPHSHDGYTTWEEYLENVAQIQNNRTTGVGGRCSGAVLRGSALLTRKIRCGKCFHSMTVYYEYSSRFKDYRYPHYYCKFESGPNKITRCQQIPGRQLDLDIVPIILKAIEPDRLELLLETINKLEADVRTVDVQLTKQRDSAQRDVNRLSSVLTSLDAKDPLQVEAIKVTAIALGVKKKELEQYEERIKKASVMSTPALGPDDLASIRSLSEDLLQVWSAPTTTNEDRKLLFRCLVDEVIVDRISETEVKIVIKYNTGRKDEETIILENTMHHRPNTAALLRTEQSTLDLVKEFASMGYTAARVAAEMNAKGIKSRRGKAFTQGTIFHLFQSYKIPHRSLSHRKAQTLSEIRPSLDGRYRASDIALIYGVSASLVTKRCCAGIYDAVRDDHKYKPRWLIKLPDVEVRRLGLTELPPPKII
jgi:DNA invertase Pin-like site-specific DNA recombinase